MGFEAQAIRLGTYMAPYLVLVYSSKTSWRALASPSSSEGNCRPSLFILAWMGCFEDLERG